MPEMTSDPDVWRAEYGQRFTIHHVNALGEYQAEQDDRRATTRIDEAQVFSSLDPSDFLGETHRPVLDIDVPAWLTPSSTPGHTHLVIDVPMTWDAYRKLLAVLVEVGILEDGYVGASEARGYTSARLPWVRKDA